MAVKFAGKCAGTGLKGLLLILVCFQFCNPPAGYSLGKSDFKQAMLPLFSNKHFETTQLELTRPNGGENWLAGSVQSIRWNSNKHIGDIHINYSLDAGNTWRVLRENVPDNGRYDFVVPGVESDSAMIMLQSTEIDSVFDVSDSVFSIFRKTQTVKNTCIPRPVTLTIDDVGWKLGRDDSDKNGPYRLGVNRDPVFRDYEVLVYVAKKVGVRLSGRFVVSEFDRENVLANYPTTNEWGSNWDNSQLIRGNDFEIMNYVKEHSAWLELGIHGVRHEYWDWENENGKMVRTEFYDEIHNKPWPFDILMGHLFAFRSILAQYGIQTFPESYTTPGNGYFYKPNSKDDSGALFHSMGVKYAITDIIQTGNYGMPKEAILNGGIIDHGVLLIQQSRYVPNWPHWDAINDPPVYIPENGIPLTHWPNWWAQNPENDFQVGDKFVKWFRMVDETPDIYVPRNTAQYYSQWLYRKYCLAEHSEDTIVLDNRQMPDDAYRYHLLGNLVLKIKLQPDMHIQKATIDHDAEIVGYFEKDGFAYLFLSMLKQNIYHLAYEFGPRKPLVYLWNDGTYNIREFKTAQNGVYINLELYGKQDIKVKIPFRPDFVRLIGDSLTLLNHVYDESNQEVIVTLKNNSIVGRTGAIIIGKGSFGQITFSGTLRYYSSGELIPDAGMVIKSKWETSTVEPLENPFYLKNLGYGESYCFLPYRKSTQYDGSILTMYDAALVARYSVGLNSLNKFQTFAADVSGDGMVMMYDASMIARHVVGLPIPGNTQVGEWKFYPDSLFFVNVKSDKDSVNFIGYVLGDVSGNWANHSQTTEAKFTRNEKIEKIIKISGDTLLVNLGEGFSGEFLSVYIDISYPEHQLNFLGIDKYPIAADFKTFLNINRNRIRFGAFNLQRIINRNTRLTLKFLLSDKNTSFTNININSYRVNGEVLFSGETNIRMYKSVTNSFKLLQNYPNPFNGVTRIEYSIPRNMDIVLNIFNSIGENVISFSRKNEKAGENSILWDGRNRQGQKLPSGLYFIELKGKQLKAYSKIIFLN